MLRSILIGLDGSEYSSSALTLGLRWARRHGAVLAGLGVIDEPAICRPEMVPIGGGTYKEQSDRARLARARQRVEEFLEQFARLCSEAGVAYELLEDVGQPYGQILREAQRYDLILLGQRTHFHFATQDSADNTLHEVLKNSPRPVVTVPPILPQGVASVVAYDGSLQAARVLQAFQASGLYGADEVHVVGVGADSEQAFGHVERAVDFLRSHDVQATAQVVPYSGGVAETLLEQARRLNAGLMVMGAYGQPALREFFLGSVTRSVLKAATLPLFLYH